jgi:hypothetical protein
VVITIFLQANMKKKGEGIVRQYLTPKVYRTFTLLSIVRQADFEKVLTTVQSAHPEHNWVIKLGLFDQEKRFFLSRNHGLSYYISRVQETEFSGINLKKSPPEKGW